MVQNGFIWVQSNTKHENGHNSPKQPWAKNQIFEHICIFWTNIFICKNICWFFIDWIYSNFISWPFYHAKYIRIFIRQISMVTNIFGYSFVQKNDIHPTLVLKCVIIFDLFQWHFHDFFCTFPSIQFTWSVHPFHRHFF